MAWAICGSCGKEVRWKAGRGARLKDVRCPNCGGIMRSATAGRKMGPRRPSSRCVVCGRLRFTGVFTIPEDGTCKRWDATIAEFVDVRVKKGDIVCWTGHYYDKGGSAQDTAVGNVSRKVNSEEP